MDTSIVSPATLIFVMSHRFVAGSLAGGGRRASRT
jgi:hypothetical protein